MKARDIMTAPVFTVTAASTLEEVARLMQEHRLSGLPVVDDAGKLIGIVTESDFLAREEGMPFSTFRWPQLFGQWMPKADVEKIYQAARTKTVGAVMTERTLVTATPDDDMDRVVKLMMTQDVNRVPIIDEAGKPVGIITRHDLLQMMTPGRPDKS